MKKGYMGICMILLCLLLTPMQTLAENHTVERMEINVDEGKLTVTGEVTGVFACAICVYDESGSMLQAMETCQVKADNSFCYTMENSLGAGTYLVAVADYQGGVSLSKMVEIKDSSETNQAKPTATAAKTGDDGIPILAACGGFLIAAAALLLFVGRKQKHFK